MKNFLLTLILTVVFISDGFTQKIQFGLIAGPVITSSNKANQASSGDRSNKVESNFSFFAGGVASIPISKSFVFKPQLQYITKGWTNHFDYTDPQTPDEESKLTSHWIELPLNFLYTVPAKNGRFFFGLGPSVACALSGNYRTVDNVDREIVFKENDGTSAITANRIDVGVNIVGQYEFRNGLFLSLNYSHGFIDFRNDLDTDVDPSNKNNVAGLGIGYMFK